MAAVRDAVAGLRRDAAYASPGYVLAWTIVLLFIGLTLERRVRARVQLT